MRFTKTIASASVAAVLGLAGVSVAGASSNAGSAPAAAPSATVGCGLDVRRLDPRHQVSGRPP